MSLLPEDPLVAFIGISSDNSGSKKAFFYGSGILVQVKSRLALLTARHVAEESSKFDTLLHMGRGTIPLQSQYVICPNVDQSQRFFFTYEGETADVAFILLNDEQSEAALVEKRPIPMEKLSLRETAGQNSIVLLGGFPENLNSPVLPTGRIDHHLLSYTRGPPVPSHVWPEPYSRGGHDCYFFRRSGLGREGEPVLAPSPPGMSGGLAIAVDRALFDEMAQRQGNQLSIVDFFGDLVGHSTSVYPVGVILAWYEEGDRIVTLRASSVARWINDLMADI